MADSDYENRNDSATEAINALKSLGLLSDEDSLSPPGLTPSNYKEPQISPPGLTPDVSGNISPLLPTKPQATNVVAPSLQERTNSTSPTDLRSPFNPYGTNSNLPNPRKIGDVTGATQDVNQELNNEKSTAEQAATDKYLSTKAKSDKLIAANDQYVKDLADADKQHQIARDQAHKVAAAETAQWMQEMDRKAAEEPRPGRWWDNESSFGKCMWLLSLAFGTIGAAKAPGVRNVAADMISSEIDGDMQRQKDKLNRLYEMGKIKGQKLTQDQQERLADLNDDYSHKVGRINALLAANTVRANAVSDPDLKAMYSAIDSELTTQKTQIAIKRVDNAVQERLKLAEEAHADVRQSIQLKHAETMQANQQTHADKMQERLFEQQKELAQTKIDAKQAELEAKAKNKETHFEFPQQSGITISSKDETGKPIFKNLSVPKEMAKEAHEIAANGQKKFVTLSSLRDAIKEDGLPYSLFSNSNQSRQALAAAVDPMIKQMGGRFNAASAKALTDMIMGEDPSNLIQRMKGGSKEDIIKLLDKEIQEVPGSTKQDLLSIPGTNLADNPNDTLTFTPQETRGPKEHQLTGDEKIANATGQAPPIVVLKTKKDVEQFGDEAFKSLPSDIQSIVSDARSKLEEGHTKENVRSIYTQASHALEMWQKAHNATSPDFKGGTTVNNAYELLDAAEAKANKLADKLPEVKVSIAAHSHGNPVDKEDVQNELTRRGLTLSTTQIQSMVNDINAGLGSIYRK